MLLLESCRFHSPLEQNVFLVEMREFVLRFSGKISKSYIVNHIGRRRDYPSKAGGKGEGRYRDKRFVEQRAVEIQSTGELASRILDRVATLRVHIPPYSDWIPRTSIPESQ